MIREWFARNSQPQVDLPAKTTSTWLTPASSLTCNTGDQQQIDTNATGFTWPDLAGCTETHLTHRHPVVGNIASFSGSIPERYSKPIPLEAYSSASIGVARSWTWLETH